MDLQTAEAVAIAFCNHYYGMFDTDRSSLASLFYESSLMKFEGDTKIGVEAIMKKLLELPFKVVKHIPTTVDGQPTIDNGVLITVNGQLKTDDDPPHAFSEMFHLKNSGGGWIILNNAFRLSIHNS
ncbi:nuclear transport factor 2 isoform X1 [Hydra vulgaris]|uniref:Nuclear transport factor 2 n=1 Tax=Hydra vulgaris TaxID=6087 RepID=T2MFB7_HYDVU|nr:nuclear transport factor 2 [Hydra vulgaris]